MEKVFAVRVTAQLMLDVERCVSGLQDTMRDLDDLQNDLLRKRQNLARMLTLLEEYWPKHNIQERAEFAELLKGVIVTELK